MQACGFDLGVKFNVKHLLSVNDSTHFLNWLILEDASNLLNVLVFADEVVLLVEVSLIFRQFLFSSLSVKETVLFSVPGEWVAHHLVASIRYRGFNYQRKSRGLGVFTGFHTSHLVEEDVEVIIRLHLRDSLHHILFTHLVHRFILKIRICLRALDLMRF